MALGVAKAGFKHLAVVERDDHAFATLAKNKAAGVYPVRDWNIVHLDVADFDYSQYQGIDLIAGGPPCQPFSQGGKGLGQGDHRDMFPEAIRAVRESRPRFFLFENVKGLLRSAFWDYCDYIELQLRYLNLTRRSDEQWVDHHLRLRQHHLSSGSEACYRVAVHHFNAADYGAPQLRERVFMIGVRSDVKFDFRLSRQSHTSEALYWSKWVTGEYWERHGIPAKYRQSRPHDVDRCRASAAFSALAVTTEPWMTVRDAIKDLPLPALLEADASVLGHVLIPGARSYPGHTGSLLDEPSKALKAGAHGVPGGENMVISDDGAVRYFTLRECARLQCFPDEFVLPVPWTRTMGALGNAVPTKLATMVASALMSDAPWHG